MSFKKAYDYLNERNMSNRIQQFDVSSATVELAAKAVGTEPAKIAKSLTFMVEDKPVMVISAGNVKINNSKYKKVFHMKAKMLSGEQVKELIGHEIGGVCPFGINDGVKVYLDDSLREYEYIYPACGNGNSAVKLTPEELYELSNAEKWIDVCVPI